MKRMNKLKCRHKEHNLIPYLSIGISQFILLPAYLDPPFIRFSENSPSPTIWTPPFIRHQRVYSVTTDMLTSGVSKLCYAFSDTLCDYVFKVSIA